jgi:hypothetical protein
MAKQQGLRGDDPYPILESLPGRVSRRKLRLFGCGCCRQRVWHLLTDVRSRRAVEVAERYAEGEADPATLRAAWLEAGRACQARGTAGFRSTVKTNAAAAAALAAHRNHSARAVAGRVFATVWYGEGLNNEARRGEERAAHLVLVRCVFGDTLQPVTIDPAWRSWNDGTVPQLAQAIYENRTLPEGTLDTTRLAVLADALEEAGCDDADLLAHCRGPGPHVRGCWVVDLLLGKK